MVWEKRATDAKTISALLAPISGLVGAFLRSWADRKVDPPGARMPLPQRVSYVQEGGEQHLAVILHGTLAWCPPAYNSQRTLHVMGTGCWHTQGLVSTQIDVPTGDLRVQRIRPAQADIDVEHPALQRRTWAALDLAAPGPGRATVLAHRTDLALLGLVSGWDYPR